MPRAAPSVPNVVIRAGTRSRVTQKPVNPPQIAPLTSATTKPRTNTPQPPLPPAKPRCGPRSVIDREETTPAKTSTEPMDRSKPAATMT